MQQSHAVATVVMARLEGELDRDRLRLALNGQLPDPSDLPAGLGTATAAE